MTPFSETSGGHLTGHLVAEVLLETTCRSRSGDIVQFLAFILVYLVLSLKDECTVLC